MHPNFKLIDCTFRDGGYCNDWFFEKEMVEETLSVFEKLPIDYVEIGFRKYEEQDSLGAHLYTTEEYINSLKLPKNQKLALMCDIQGFEGFSDEEIQKAFVPKKESKVELIRVAGRSSGLDHAVTVAKLIQELGYKVSLNIMHVSVPSKEKLKKDLQILQGQAFDMVYLADTMGNIAPSHLGSVIESARLFYDGELGFHAHDNRGFAMMNVLYALENGVKWIDGSLSGMGRGAGNLLTESFLIEMDYQHRLNLDLTDLFELNEKYFWPMQQKYEWGYSPYYHLGSVEGVHPFEIQKFLSQKRISVKDKIDFIKRREAK